MSNELKPCPFCGDGDVVESSVYNSHVGWHVSVMECKGCHAFAPFDVWNRRAQPAEADGVEVVAWRCEASKPGIKTQVRLVFTWPEAESFAHHYEERGCKVTTTALVEKAKHRAALSAVTAERDRLQARATQLEAEAIYTSAGIADDRERIKQLRAEVEALRPFANEIVSGALEGGSFDGGDIQEMAVQHGLLRAEQREESCGEACGCSEFGFPSECFRKTELLRDAAMAAKEG